MAVGHNICPTVIEATSILTWISPTDTCDTKQVTHDSYLLQPTLIHMKFILSQYMGEDN
jgi:hypothetical protein